MRRGATLRSEPPLNLRKRCHRGTIASSWEAASAKARRRRAPRGHPPALAAGRLAVTSALGSALSCTPHAPPARPSCPPSAPGPAPSPSPRQGCITSTRRWRRSRALSMLRRGCLVLAPLPRPHFGVSCFAGFLALVRVQALHVRIAAVVTDGTTPAVATAFDRTTLLVHGTGAFVRRVVRVHNLCGLLHKYDHRRGSVAGTATALAYTHAAGHRICRRRWDLVQEPRHGTRPCRPELFHAPVVPATVLKAGLAVNVQPRLGVFCCPLLKIRVLATDSSAPMSWIAGWYKRCATQIARHNVRHAY